MRRSSIPVYLNERLEDYENVDRLVDETLDTDVFDCNVDYMSTLCQSDFQAACES